MSCETGGEPPRYDEFIDEFSKNSRRLYGYIRSLVPDINDANDVYQSSSLVMWKKFAEFKTEGNFFAWGCRVALFEVRKLRDSRKRHHIFSDEALELLHVEISRRPDDAPRRHAALTSCIQKLNTKARWLIEQRYFHDRKPCDIAPEYGRSVATVYRALALVHSRLLSCIQRTLSEGA